MNTCVCNVGMMLCALLFSVTTVGFGQSFSERRFFDTLFSTKPLGCLVEKTSTTFRVFAPRATHVSVVIFDKHTDEQGREFPMKSTNDGTWEHTQRSAPAQMYGKYYGYRISRPATLHERFDSTVIVGDPYSKAVVSQNTFRHQAKTLILNTEYDWKGDTFVIPANYHQLVLYEAHVRDMTAHPSSGVTARGTYKGLTETNKRGGLAYLKTLGVNAVELLPVHEFANIEPPYGDSSVFRRYGVFNESNRYERNHWGYMTSYYFAPEAYYAIGSTMQSNEALWTGADGRAVREMKDMVRALHNEGIAVILDVVYNHVSDFDANPLKQIDPLYYFHTDSTGKFINTSYCGNDFKTDRRMARRLIVESVKYWMREYHIDGFRFDLAAMIDTATCNEVLREARAINPNVILIAEPWGGGKYSPAQFSDIAWAAWNDQVRNGVKGQNPKDGLGFIFGKHQGSNTKRSEAAFLTGTLREDGGLFVRKEHSINYVESHDDETMGDFIRFALGDVKEGQSIQNTERNAKLTAKQLALHKLAALFLCASQGPIMIHAGQEFGRSKVIAKGTGATNDVGQLDRNSYNKDNETNWLNYAHADSNRALTDYYKGLIALRRAFPGAFGGADKRAVEFLETGNDHALAVRIHNITSNSNIKVAPKVLPTKKTPKSFVVILNGTPQTPLSITLPAGTWRVIADENAVENIVENVLLRSEKSRLVSNAVSVMPTAGMILAEE